MVAGPGLLWDSAPLSLLLQQPRVLRAHSNPEHWITNQLQLFMQADTLTFLLVLFFCSCWNTNPKSWTVWIYRVPIVLMNLVRWQINLIKCSYKARMLPFHLSIAFWPDMHAVRPWLMLISLSCRLTSSISSKL